MFYQINTVKELDEIKNKISDEVYDKIFEIISMLDRLYGENRTVDNDGGFVVFANSQEELEEAIENLHFAKKEPELVDVIGGYLNTLYLRDNEFGVNFIAPRKSKSKNKFEKWGIKYDL
jgi:antitoxin component HigA of HigAB toxin-antitoxin module